MIITIDLNGCTDDQKQLAAELMKRGESEEVIEQAIRILHVDFAEKGDFTAYGKNEVLINKAIENLNNALRENNNLFVWVDNSCLRWAVNNTKRMRASRNIGADTGNCVYGKIEAKSRKTDPFMALVASMGCENVLEFGEVSRKAKEAEMSKDGYL